MEQTNVTLLNNTTETISPASNAATVEIGMGTIMAMVFNTYQTSNTALLNQAVQAIVGVKVPFADLSVNDRRRLAAYLQLNTVEFAMKLSDNGSELNYPTTWLNVFREGVTETVHELSMENTSQGVDSRLGVYLNIYARNVGKETFSVVPMPTLKLLPNLENQLLHRKQSLAARIKANFLDVAPSHRSF